MRRTRRAEGLQTYRQEIVEQRSVKPKQYGKFLMEIFDEWVRSDVGTVFVQMFDSALASWCGLPSSVCVFQETCGRSLVMEHNGDLYACDHFVEPSHRLGNILEKPMIDLVNSPRAKRSSGWTNASDSKKMPGVRGCFCLPRGMPTQPIRGNSRGGE